MENWGNTFDTFRSFKTRAQKDSSTWPNFIARCRDVGLLNFKCQSQLRMREAFPYSSEHKLANMYYSSLSRKVVWHIFERNAGIRFREALNG